MARNASTPLAGGSLFALSVLAGVVIGTLNLQPSLGFVIGFGVGLLLLILVWLLDRRRV